MSVAKKYRGTLAKAIESYVTDRIKDHDDFDKKRVFITDSGVDMEIVETVEKLLREPEQLDLPPEEVIRDIP